MAKVPSNRTSWTENIKRGDTIPLDNRGDQDVLNPAEKEDRSKVGLSQEIMGFSIQKKVLVLFGIMFLVLVGSGWFRFGHS